MSLRVFIFKVVPTTAKHISHRFAMRGTQTFKRRPAKKTEK